MSSLVWVVSDPTLHAPSPLKDMWSLQVEEIGHHFSNTVLSYN